MRGLVFDVSVPRYALAKSVGALLPGVHYKALSGLALRELPRPSLPGPGWVRLKTRLTGLCGSDMGTLFFKMSPWHQPFTSFPAVLGHEILAEVLEVPGGELKVGQRVAVNPLLPCRLRGVQPCQACQRGIEQVCENTHDGCLAPGMLGYHRELPGGLSDELVAHVSSLYPVPDGVEDKAAALIEPLAVGLHAVLKRPPEPKEQVLIIGAGMVAFSVLWSLRALGLTSPVTFLTRHGFQSDLARRLGADEVLTATLDAKLEAQAIAQRTGARVLQPIVGPPVLAGGYATVFDCAGNQASLAAALRYTRPGGTVVVVGGASVVPSLDWTAVWRNELSVLGSYVYGNEHHAGRTQHTFAWVIELLAARAGPDPSCLVTHLFRLEDYAQAIEANLHRSRHRAIKTLFDLRMNNEGAP